ncbi:MAG TPA: TraB/GumN family protein [Variovorax sp.]
MRSLALTRARAGLAAFAAACLASMAPAPAWAGGTAAAPVPPAACPPPVTAAAPQDGWDAAARRATDHGLLWRIEKNGHASWLYGTIHVARADWALPGPTVRAALGQSDLLALEFDPLDSAATAKAVAAQAGAAASDRPLGGARTARLARQRDAACLSDDIAARLSGMPPVLQVMGLGVLAARSDGLYPEFGIDMMLSSIAHAGHKPVASLESADQQVELLGSTFRNEERAQVDEMLDQLESGQARRQLVELAEAWARSDLQTLSRYPEWCECLDTARKRRQMKRLIDDRNPKMADKIARLHAGGRAVFVAVGSLHLVGPHGLPALLAARGFSVTPVLPPG